MKKIIKDILNLSSYEIKKLKPKHKGLYIGTDQRPIGRMDFLLEDLKKRGLVCKAIIDVGANTSGWSRMAKDIFPAANFCLIEPQVGMTEKLEQFCKDFENSIYFLAGAGSKRGT